MTESGAPSLYGLRGSAEIKVFRHVERLQRKPVTLVRCTGPSAKSNADYFRLPKDGQEAAELKKLQESAFRQQLTLAYQFDCPVIVHSRAAFADTVRMIDESGVDWKQSIFHCFSEGPDEVRELNRRGGRASFTGILTYPSAGAIRAAAEAQGLDRLMLETDCPYLAPQAVRGQINEPAHLAHIAEYAAKLFNVPVEELARRSEHAEPAGSDRITPSPPRYRRRFAPSRPQSRRSVAPADRLRSKARTRHGILQAGGAHLGFRREKVDLQLRRDEASLHGRAHAVIGDAGARDAIRPAADGGLDAKGPAGVRGPRHGERQDADRAPVSRRPRE